MKKIILWFGLAVCCLLTGMFCSCQKPDTSRSYYEVIPATSSIICAFQVNQLIEKGDVKQELQARITELCQNGMDAAAWDKMQQIFKNGNGSGIDFSDYVYVFTGAEQEKAAMVAKVADVSKLQEMFGYFAEKGECTPLENQKEYTQTIVNGEIVCTFNDSRMLCVVSDNIEYSKEYSLRLMEMKEKQSIASNPCFGKMLEGKSDFKMLFSVKSLPEETKDNIAMYMNDKSIYVSEIYILGSLDFENGKISLHYNFIASDAAVLAAIQKEGEYLKKVSESVLAYYPASTLLYTMYSCNGEKMNEMLDKNDFWATMPMLDKKQTERILASLDGDIACGITGMSAMGIPDVLVYAQIKDTYPVEFLADLLKGDIGKSGVLKDHGNHNYEFNVQMLNMSFYFGAKDGKLFYLTNNKEWYDQAGRVAKDPLSHSILVSGLKNSYGGFVWNIEAMLQLPLVPLMVSKIAAPQQRALIQQILTELSYTEFLTVSQTDFVWNIYLKNKKQNSLKTLVETGNERTAVK